MPTFLLPNSHGEPLGAELSEAWSPAARAASAAARRRGKSVNKLKVIRTSALDKLAKQMVYDQNMGVAQKHILSPKSASYWKRANNASSAIHRLQAIKPTQSRPLLARFRKSLRSYL